MELCIDVVWLKHPKLILCAIPLKWFYGYIILFLDFELTSLECSVDSLIQHELYWSSTTVLTELSQMSSSRGSNIYPHRPQGGENTCFMWRNQIHRSDSFTYDGWLSEPGLDSVLSELPDSKVIMRTDCHCSPHSNSLRKRWAEIMNSEGPFLLFYMQFLHITF